MLADWCLQPVLKGEDEWLFLEKISPAKLDNVNKNRSNLLIYY